MLKLVTLIWTNDGVYDQMEPFWHILHVLCVDESFVAIVFGLDVDITTIDIMWSITREVIHQTLLTLETSTRVYINNFVIWYNGYFRTYIGETDSV